MESRLLLTDEVLPCVEDMMKALYSNTQNAVPSGFSEDWVRGYRNGLHDALKNFKMIVSTLAFDSLAEEEYDDE
jgi:hypothetical protein